MDTQREKLYQILLPQPKSVTFLPVDYSLDNESIIMCATVKDSYAGERLSDMIKDEWGLQLPVRHESTTNEYILQISRDLKITKHSSLENIESKSLHKEGYVLRVDSEKAVIRARTSRGLLWGAMTLRQLITSNDSALSIKGVYIEDYPRYDLRGFMIDSGRSPNSIPKLKRIIRICSAFKMNALFFREGDDEMNAIRYKTNKLGSLNPFAMSLEELADLSSYASKHGITLIPEVESLGHSAAKGIHYPELVSGGFETEYEGIGSHTRKSHLAPCDPRTFELLESIYDELFSTLHQPFIHLGLDETRLPMEIQADHITELLPRLSKCAEKYGIGVSPIVWSDAPETPDEYKHCVYRCLWEYGDGGPIGSENGKLVNQGINILSQQSCRQHVIMAGGSGSGHTPYAKSSYNAAYRNLAAWAKWGKSLKNYVGLFAVQWSGNMTDEWLPDFLAAADFGWTPPKNIDSFDSIDSKIRENLSRLKDASKPQPEEVDRPAWDRIWLKGDQWDEDILTKVKFDE